MVMCAGCFESFERDDLRKFRVNNDVYSYCKKCCERYEISYEEIT